MKYIINLLIIVSFLSSCNSESGEAKNEQGDNIASTEMQSQVQENEHLNIIITPDLSNRIESKLYPKPVEDTTLINSIYSNYYPDLYRINNRAIGQKDKIQVVLTNPTIIRSFNIDLNKLTIDISELSLNDRIQYLTRGAFKSDVVKASEEIKRIYENAYVSTTGGDVYNYLGEQLTTTVVKRNPEPVTVDRTVVRNIYRNIVILFTDGYIEAGLYGNSNCSNNKCYYLSKHQIDKFRRDFIKSGSNNLESFFKESGYGIIPVENKVLDNVEIIVAEMYDRSLNKTTGSQTVSPNDFEIMKLFWSDWLTKSGVKHFKLLPVSTTKEAFIANVKEFIKEQPNK